MYRSLIQTEAAKAKAIMLDRRKCVSLGGDLTSPTVDSQIDRRRGFRAVEMPSPQDRVLAAVATVSYT